MISKVRWKHEEETHGSLCIFICPYVPSVHQFTRCSSFFPPSPPFFVCQQSSFPPTPPQFILSLSVPYCTLSLPAPPAHLRWIEWTLCSKINFEMNEAIAVCVCSLILCQKWSEGYVLIYLLPRHSTFRSSHGWCCGIAKQAILLSAKKTFLFKYSWSWESRVVTKVAVPWRSLDVVKASFWRTQVPYRISLVVLMQGVYPDRTA